MGCPQTVELVGRFGEVMPISTLCYQKAWASRPVSLLQTKVMPLCFKHGIVYSSHYSDSKRVVDCLATYSCPKKSSRMSVDIID